MSLIALIAELLAGLMKLLNGQMAAAASQRQQEIGASLQREQDMKNEESRIRAATDASLGGVSDPADQADRDRQP